MWTVRIEDRDADARAIRRVASGDQSAMAELYDRHSRFVYSLALRILEDQADAEDIVQEVFSQAWAQAGRHDVARGSVGAWLLMMTRSRAIDRLRSRRGSGEAVPFAEGDALQLADLSPSQEAVASTAEQVSRVRDALSRLPLLQRVSLELAFYEGLSHREIAERLEQPLGTVKTRIRLALMKLREALLA